MIKIVKYRLNDTAEDYSWALALDENQRISLAAKLTRDLWNVAHNSEFPTMDRSVVHYFVSGNETYRT